jgi:hypothetical protein
VALVALAAAQLVNLLTLAANLIGLSCEPSRADRWGASTTYGASWTPCGLRVTGLVVRRLGVLDGSGSARRKRRNDSGARTLCRGRRSSA